MGTGASTASIHVSLLASIVYLSKSYRMFAMRHACCTSTSWPWTSVWYVVVIHTAATQQVVLTSAAWCQLFKFDSISALSNSIFDIIGLARTSQEYHQRFLRTDKNYNFCINFIKMLFNILNIKPSFGDFVIWYRFLMLFDAGLSIVRYRFWAHIRCRFNMLKYHAALVLTLCAVRVFLTPKHCSVSVTQCLLWWN